MKNSKVKFFTFIALAFVCLVSLITIPNSKASATSGLTYTGTYEGSAVYDQNTKTYSVTKVMTLWSRFQFSYNDTILTFGETGNTTVTGLYKEGDADWSTKLYTTDYSTLICGSSLSHTYKFVYDPSTSCLHISTISCSVSELFENNYLELISKQRFYIATKDGYAELLNAINSGTTNNLSSDDSYHRYQVALFDNETDAIYLDYYVNEKTFVINFMTTKLFMSKTFEPSIETYTYDVFNVLKGKILKIENSNVSNAFWSYVYSNIDVKEFDAYSVGVNSVDITTDNQDAIDSYIEENNYHSDTEYDEYGFIQYESGYTAGTESVDITSDNQDAIDSYIEENNYHSDTEYNEYGNIKYNQGFNDAQESNGNHDLENDTTEDVKEFVESFFETIFSIDSLVYILAFTAIICVILSITKKK